MAELDCRHFTGYKPCGLSENCHPACPYKDPVKSRILLIHLEALGSVLRGTCLLPAIRRRFPNSHITWVTKKIARPLLEGNPLIDRIVTCENILPLMALEFDATFCVDKSLEAIGILNSIQTMSCFGFVTDSKTGAILPATKAAEALWELGLSNQKKFFENTKTENQLLVEALELGPYQRDPYIFDLGTEEKSLSQERRVRWLQGNRVLIGINTGCASMIPFKKLSVSGHRRLIYLLSKLSSTTIILLGGSEDTLRNREIAKSLDVVCSPTEGGLRDGLCSVNACDIVISGDSLGMHMAIALKKWVIAWFGPTCPQEIELYGRGEKIITTAPCHPCWKRSCQKLPMCYDLVNLNDIVKSVKKGITCTTSSSKLPFLEISS